MIRTECNICQKKYRFENHLSGSIVYCKECCAEFEVPVKSIWQKFAEENPDAAITVRWSVGGVVGALVLVTLTVGAFQLNSSMRNRDSTADLKTAGLAHQRPIQPTLQHPIAAPATATATVTTPLASNARDTIDPHRKIPENAMLDQVLGFPDTAELQALAIRPDGTGFLTAHGSRTLNKHQLPGLRLMGELGGVSDRITALTVSPDNHTVLCGTETGDIIAWGWQGRERARLQNLHTAAVTGLIVTRDGNVLSTDLGGSVLQTNLQTQTQHDRGGSGQRKPVTHLSVSSDGNRIAFSRIDGQVRTWNALTGTGEVELNVQAPCMRVAASNDGQRIATASRNMVHLYSTERRAREAVIGGTSQVTQLKWSRNNQLCAIGYADGQVRLLGGGILSEQKKFRMDSAIVALHFLPGNSHLLMAAADGRIETQPLATGGLGLIANSPPAPPADPSVQPLAAAPVTDPARLIQSFRKQAAEYPIGIESALPITGQPDRARLTGRGFSKATGLVLLFTGFPETRPEYTIIDDRTIEVTIEHADVRKNIMFGIETAEGLVVTVPDYSDDIPDSQVVMKRALIPRTDATPHQLAFCHVIIPKGRSVRVQNAPASVFLLLDDSTLEVNRTGPPIMIVRTKNTIAPPSTGAVAETYLEYPAIFPCPVPELFNDEFLPLLKKRR